MGAALLLYAALFACQCARVDRWHTLSDELRAIADSCSGEMGIALISDSGDTITVNDSVKYPLMSVFKLHQAIATCRFMEQQGVSLDSIVDIPRNSLNPATWSPMMKDHCGDTLSLSYRSLLRYALEQSDNNASNYLFDSVLCVDSVDSAIARIIPRHGFKLAHTEAEMQRNHALAYDNRTSPVSAAMLIYSIYTDSAFSSPAMQFIRQSLRDCKTGLDRIPAALQGKEDVKIGHKTGSGFRGNGLLAAHNDVAFVSLPDGTNYALAVFIKDFNGSDEEASRLIADVTAAVCKAFY